MNDKEKKLTEALKEYFGKDVGDVDHAFVESNVVYRDLPRREKYITIITGPHKPTFEEKRQELVDQLNKDLKEINKDLSVETNASLIDVYIEGHKEPIFEIYGVDDPPAAIQSFDILLSFSLVKRVMDTIAELLDALNSLREQYKND